jgi:hypothetical protein
MFKHVTISLGLFILTLPLWKLGLGPSVLLLLHICNWTPKV